MSSGPSSCDAKITVERLAYPELEADLPAVSYTNLSVHLSGSATVEWAPPGRSSRLRPVRGQITLIPEGSAGRLRVRDGACEIIKIGIPGNAPPTAEPEPPSTPFIERLGASDPLAFQLALALLEEHERPGTVDTLYLDALSGALLAHLLRAHTPTQHPSISHREVRPLPPRRAGAAVAFMQDNLAVAIGLDDIARELSMSTSHFAAQFRRSFDTTPARYLTWLRLDRARALLEGSQLPVTAIARRVGFSNASHFSQAFRAEYGQTPSQWRSRHS